MGSGIGQGQRFLEKCVALVRRQVPQVLHAYWPDVRAEPIERTQRPGRRTDQDQRRNLARSLEPMAKERVARQQELQILVRRVRAKIQEIKPLDAAILDLDAVPHLIALLESVRIDPRVDRANAIGRYMKLGTDFALRVVRGRYDRLRRLRRGEAASAVSLELVE